VEGNNLHFLSNAWSDSCVPNFLTLLQVGPDWFCMLFTYCLIIIPSLLFIIYIADVISIILTILSSLSLAVLLACYSYAACSDPGIVWKDSYMVDPESEGISGAKIGMIECSQCQMMRPCTAMHCYDCGVCVEDVSPPPLPS
jgi:hypothetical protein